MHGPTGYVERFKPYTSAENLRRWIEDHDGVRSNMHTLLLFAVFSVLTTVSLELATDSSVAFWIGKQAWVVPFLPLLFLVVYCGHISGRSSPLLTTVFSTMAPAIAAIVIGYTYQVPLNRLASAFTLSGCQANPELQKLQDAYDAAEDVHDLCVVHLASTTGKTPSTLRTNIILENCASFPEYSVQYAIWGREWEYLEYLEVSQGCTGWCNSGGRSLWTLPDHVGRDDCSTVATTIIESQAVRLANLLIVCGICTLLLSFTMLVLFQDSVMSPWFVQ